MRGPKTRNVLKKNNIQCPEIYGDPAILMPCIYKTRNPEKRYKISLVTHYRQNTKVYDEVNRINMLTVDYKNVIDAIVSSELIVSSSLHGIILAEAYGVPAVLLLDENQDIFKYQDYYYSTERYNLKVAHSLLEAIKITPMDIPNFEKMRQNILKVFPYDLWE